MISKRNFLLYLGVTAFFLISISILPGSSDAASNDATVRVEYNGMYFGTIEGDGEIQEVEGYGTDEFDAQGDVINVIMSKLDETDDEMTVSILVDGDARVTRSTSEPMGEVRLSYSFLASGNNSEDDDDDDGDDDGGGGCGSMILAPTLLLAVVTFALIIRKRNQ